MCDSRACTDCSVIRGTRVHELHRLWVLWDLPWEGGSRLGAGWHHSGLSGRWDCGIPGIECFGEAFPSVTCGCGRASSDQLLALVNCGSVGSILVLARRWWGWKPQHFVVLCGFPVGVLVPEFIAGEWLGRCRH